MARKITTEQFNRTLRAISPRLNTVLRTTGDVTEQDVARACAAENSALYREAQITCKKPSYFYNPGVQKGGQFLPGSMSTLGRFADAFLAA